MKVGTIARNAVPVVLGVFVAGLIMNFGRDIELINQARNGFDV